MSSYNRNDMRNVIDSYVVNPRYRQILCLRFCEGFTMDQVAEATNYSTQHVKHICKSYKDLLISLL